MKKSWLLSFFVLSAKFGDYLLKPPVGFSVFLNGGTKFSKNLISFTGCRILKVCFSNFRLPKSDPT